MSEPIGKRNALPLLIGALACLIILAFSAYGTQLNRGLKLDFANFYDAGSKAALGQFRDLYNPFAEIGGAPPFGNMSFVSAPVTSFLYAPLAGMEPAQAATVFKATMTLTLLVALVLLYLHLARRFAPNDPAKFFAAYAVGALIFMPFWVMYTIGGQTTPLILLLFVIALIGVSNGRTYLPVAALVIATLIKPVFAPGMIFILIVAPAKTRSAMISIGLALAIVSFLTVGFAPHIALAEKILSEGRDLQIPHLNSYMLAWVEPLFLSMEDYAVLDQAPGSVRALSLALKLGLAAVLISLFVRLRRETTSAAVRQHFMILVAVFISLIITPAAWAHYLSFLFVLPAMAFANADRFPRAALMVAALAVAMAFFQHPFLVRKFIDITDAAGGGAFLSIDKWSVLFSISVIKSIPMLLIFALVTIWFSYFAASYRAFAQGADRT